MKTLLYFLSIALAITLVSCGGTTPEGQEGTDTETPVTNTNTEEPSEATRQLKEDQIPNIIKSIPNPLEVAFLIKDIGTEYQKGDLNDPKSVDNYTTNYKKALNLGVYSTDLGYANIYEVNQDALNYLNSVKKLADGLSIGQFFDYKTIKRLTNNTDNLDSLLQLTTSNFEKINFHLSKQRRDYLSILILTGGWMEASYITSLVYEESANEKLKEKIGEQKIVLERILLVLEVYKGKPYFEGLINNLNELKTAYEKVEIVEQKGQPVMKVVGDEIVIESTTKTFVEVTDEDLNQIISLIRSIRNEMVSES
ncbi:MAG: hypothetical protein AAF740_04950 [Bacteroidota bacterium]